MKPRAFALFAVTASFGLGLFGLQACSGEGATIGGTPAVDSGTADQTTSPPPPVDGSSGNDTGAGNDTGVTADTSVPPVPGVCGFATEAGNAFECDDPAMCPAGNACCFQGNVQSDPVCGTLFGSKVKGTICRTACGAGELVVCSRDSECTGSASGPSCNPVSTKGHTFGICGAPPVGGGNDGGLDGGGSDCGKPPSLHPTDGGTGPFCPFADSGTGTRFCAFGQTCCHASNTDPETCK